MKLKFKKYNKNKTLQENTVTAELSPGASPGLAAAAAAAAATAATTATGDNLLGLGGAPELMGGQRAPVDRSVPLSAASTGVCQGGGAVWGSRRRRGATCVQNVTPAGPSAPTTYCGAAAGVRHSVLTSASSASSGSQPGGGETIRF
eukprot:CAMPEP_0194690890 /NCGR_PEP_ID=MMETSP0295-20121207/18661_1 /TAXON_ID=39354 /ORGANISM="Heterosigma akashiwo, Strain CCMP2393" /LENGTH=146 /DNA_ID=CAMNT_0039580579 /DNA_START=1792 /DNA_END=2231 /DNA_ORIENTATION=+